MRLSFVLINFLLMLFAISVAAQENFEIDTIKTSAGDLKMTFIGHGSLMFTFGGKVMHVDPYSKVADYNKMPKADVILLTHDHLDHLDLKALNPVRTPKTLVVLTQACAKQVEGGMVMNNGDVKVIEGLKIEAVPAYNIIHKRDGQPFEVRIRNMK